MKNKIRKQKNYMLLLLVVLVLTCFAACSSETASDGNAQPTEAIEQATKVPTATPTPTPTPTPVPKLSWVPANFEETIYMSNIAELTEGKISDSLVQLDEDTALYLCYDDITTSLYEIDLKTDEITKKADTGADTFCTSVKVAADGRIAIIDDMSKNIVIYNKDYSINTRYEYGTEVFNPILTSDLSRLIYTTGTDGVTKLHIVDVNTGIETDASYMLEDITASDYFDARGLYFNDRVLHLECYDIGGLINLYVDIEAGCVIETISDVNIGMKTYGDDYVANAYINGESNELIFGSLSDKDDVNALMYDFPSECGSNTRFGDKLFTSAYIYYGRDDLYSETILSCYDLATGGVIGRTSYISEDQTLSMMLNPSLLYEAEQFAYGLLGGYENNYLYKWDVYSPNNVSDVDGDYVFKYHGNEIINADEFKRMQDYASELSEKYGVLFVIGNDLSVELDSYTIDTVENVRLIRETLRKLDEYMSRYPEDFFRQLGDTDERILQIVIVGKMLGLEGTDTVEVADAMYYDYDDGQMILVSCGDVINLETNFYHEMSHAADSYLVMRDDDFEEGWLELNREDFSYAYFYKDYEEIDESMCMYEEDDNENVYFIDDYAKTYPTEDRARLMEYALRNGLEYYDEYPRLLEKLEYLYDAIMENFDTTNWTEGFFDFEDRFSDEADTAA